jgi:hypothetical protein
MFAARFFCASAFSTLHHNRGFQAYSIFSPTKSFRTLFLSSGKLEGQLKKLASTKNIKLLSGVFD